MIQHPVPARPWQFNAADLFEFQGKEYLVTTDYHSNFCEVDKLSSQTSREVIDKLKCQMARHGIPDTLRSDNKQKLEVMKNSENSSNLMSYYISDLARLEGLFSMEEHASMLEKAKSVLHKLC
ncbi:hypothetical protein ACROYT_G013910 [Oculina patagonica]